jgi:hypothetical protein
LRIAENLTGYDLEALLAIVHDIDVKPSSSKPLVLVQLLGSWLRAAPLELDKEHSPIGREEQPIRRVPLMELVD